MEWVIVLDGLSRVRQWQLCWCTSNTKAVRRDGLIQQEESTPFRCERVAYELDRAIAEVGEPIRRP